MNKGDLVAAVQKAVGQDYSKAATERFVSATIEAIGGTLKKGNSVQLIGFGTFSIGKRAARIGRNPQTGEPLKIKASKTIKFTAGKALKDAVNGNKKK